MRGRPLISARQEKFNINVFKKELTAYISQNDSEKLATIFEEINHPVSGKQAA